MDNLKDQEVLGNNWASSGDEMNGRFAAQAPHCLLIMANRINHFESKFLNLQMSVFRRQFFEAEEITKFD